MKQQSADQNWIMELLQPLFDRIGLNGAQGVRRSQMPPAQSSTQPTVTVKQLKAQGFSDEDIEYLRRNGQVH